MGSFKPRILIIEDDPFLGPSLKEFLEARDFDVFLSPDGKDFSLAGIDLVVLDLMLPEIPGEVILYQIKQKEPFIPVLILTAKGTLKDKRDCFEKGADDYLVKPFEVEELLLRIKVLLRRNKLNEIYKVGDLIIDVSSGLIKSPQGQILLSSRAWSLLVYLLRNRGKLVNKEEIFRYVWKDTIVTEDSIRAYIKELRKVLPKDTIKTVKGRGYLLR